MQTTDRFTVNGKPLLLPDAGVTCSFEDLDSYAAGRDQSGVMHRDVVRYKVGSWTFSYGFLTEAEKQYMEGLFPKAATFTFGYPDPVDAGKPAPAPPTAPSTASPGTTPPGGCGKTMAFPLLNVRR